MWITRFEPTRDTLAHDGSGLRLAVTLFRSRPAGMGWVMSMERT